MGPDVVTKAAEQRIRQLKAQAETNNSASIQPKDFDCRPIGYQREETATMKHPIPLPNVLSYLKVCRRSKLLEGERLIRVTKFVRYFFHNVIYYSLWYFFDTLKSKQSLPTSWAC